jgi:hypothetical protein
MEQCQNCKHPHKGESCKCGCAVFQALNDPLVFNSIAAGEDIQKRIESLKRGRRDA